VRFLVIALEISADSFFGGNVGATRATVVRRIVAHSITNTLAVAVKASGVASRCRIEPCERIDLSKAA
jgi:hypothetical protein